MKKVVFYTFDVGRNTSFKIARELEYKNHEVLFLAPQFSFYRMSQMSPDTHFLGFGEYMQTAKKMRLETLAQNHYGNQILVPGGEEVIPLFQDFTLNDSCLLSNVVTNGPCNRAAYFLANQFGSEQSAFLHIPHLYDKQIAEKTLLDLRQQWQNLV